MKILFRDLIILTFASFVSVLARKSKTGMISWILIAGFSIFTVYQNRSILSPKDFKLDEDAELLIKLTSPSDLNPEGALAKYLSQEGISYQIAFRPEDAEKTELDNYLQLNIPQSNAITLNEIKKRLAKFDEVSYIEENEVIQISPVVSDLDVKEIATEFNDPLSSEQWALEALNVGALQDLLIDRGAQKQARLFILDTGVDANHEDIKVNYRSHRSKYDTDVQSHGTHCAGIAGAVSNNGKGVASMLINPDFFTISSIKVLNDMGMGTQKKIVDGIIEAADNGADVISLSLGGRSTDKRQKVYGETVEYANSKGAIVVVAAGNSGMNAKGYSPANTKGVITVAAIDQNKNLATFSNTVEDIAMGIAAPGVGILSTIPGNDYKAYNGTSMATPYVAGLVALMKSINPSLQTEEVYELLNDNGQYTTASSKSGNLIDPAKTIKNLVGARSFQ
ncbi:S8 family serine peptidase [Portibacter marinus]|uniref:S8 family serine peptidase n=1 Tax=Portibacter marinus TaxID=2898660 RepID=UPI001F300979|nr:S8 family serine peptidase [Portibacter marinus]